MLLKASTVFAKMNSFSKLKQPFIFGLDFELKQGFFSTPDNAIHQGIRFSIQGNSNETLSETKAAQVCITKKPINPHLYNVAFDNVTRHIKQGNSYLVNLTFPTKIESNISLSDIYKLSKAKYKLLFQNDFVVFSPETFITINNGIISSFPMKGTIDASVEDAENKLMNDSKEIAEHNTIVDLIRNDIGIVAEKVEVKRFRYIDTIHTHDKTLLQVSSEIRGELHSHFLSALGDLFKKLLPAGSISGAPKVKTVQIIKESEIESRGFYTGVFGYYNGSNLDSAVMIRFIRNYNNQLIFHSGGGITINSNCETEYKELIDKIYVPIV